MGPPVMEGDALESELLKSFGTWADHGGLGGINQGHVDALRAVLWADDLGQALWSWLAQQLTWKNVRVG